MGREGGNRTVGYGLKTVGPRPPATGYRLLATILVLVILPACPAWSAISIDLVPVGDAGNVGELSGDPSYGTDRICGAVAYDYQIGKYEVTNAQYMEFLNSVARYGDPYRFHGTVGVYPQRGIIRGGAGTIGDPYVYSLTDNDPNWASKPVNYVSWYSSLRFINWLQNGQPTAEAGPGVTETGTYTFTDPSTVSIPDHSALVTPHYALPTEDEWYKAAYYKAGGTAAGYWDYATQSDTLPDNNPPWLDTGNSVNYALLHSDPNEDHYVVGPPYYMTDIGAYALSNSAYGTYDQNGNAFELLQDPSPYGLPARGIRGGDWSYYQGGLRAYVRDFDCGPDYGVASLGFRVALVPEPCTLGLLLLAGLGVLRRPIAGGG